MRYKVINQTFPNSGNGDKSWKTAFITGKTPRRFHRLTHDRNKIWYYTYVREQY